MLEIVGAGVEGVEVGEEGLAIETGWESRGHDCRWLFNGAQSYCRSSFDREARYMWLCEGCISQKGRDMRRRLV